MTTSLVNVDTILPDGTRYTEDCQEIRTMTERPRPFSGPHYRENVRKADNLCLDPCCLCGRPLKKPTIFVHVIEGGAAFCEEGRDCNGYNSGDPADLGCFPIGADCYKKLLEGARA